MVLDRERLIQDIRDFVGQDGYLPFEHGYIPTIDAYAVDYGGIYGKTRHDYRPFDELCTEAIANTVFELFRYMNYCQLKA